MKKKVFTGCITTILLIVLLINGVFAAPDENLEADKEAIFKNVLQNASKNNNVVLIDVDIIGHTGKKDFFVGDYFYYNISIKNIGMNPLEGTFNVIIYDPNGEPIEKIHTYSRNIKPNETTYLHQDSVSIGIKGIWLSPFYTSGTYKLKVNFSQYLTFITLDIIKIDEKRIEGKDRWRFDSYEEFIDVMPYWQKQWIDEQKEWIVKQEQLSEKQNTIFSKQEEATESMLATSKINLFIASSALLIIIFAIMASLVLVAVESMATRHPRSLSFIKFDRKIRATIFVLPAIGITILYLSLAIEFISGWSHIILPLIFISWILVALLFDYTLDFIQPLKLGHKIRGRIVKSIQNYLDPPRFVSGRQNDDYENPKAYYKDVAREGIISLGDIGKNAVLEYDTTTCDRIIVTLRDLAKDYLKEHKIRLDKDWFIVTNKFGKSQKNERWFEEIIIEQIKSIFYISIERQNENISVTSIHCLFSLGYEAIVDIHGTTTKIESNTSSISKLIEDKNKKSVRLGSRFVIRLNEAYNNSVRIPKIDKKIKKLEEETEQFHKRIDICLDALQLVSRNMLFLFIKAVDSPPSLAKTRSIRRIEDFYESHLLSYFSDARIDEEKKKDVLENLRFLRNKMQEYKHELSESEIDDE